MAQGALKKLLKASNASTDPLAYVSLNCRESLLLDIFNECEAFPLGFDKKTVVAEDFYFLEKSRSKPKLLKDDDSAPFFAYLADPNPNVDLFLLVYSDALDERNDYAQALKKAGATFSSVQSFSPEQWKSFIPNYFEKRGSSIEPLAALTLQERIQGDYARFLNEGQKLLTYANGEPISEAMVEQLVSAPLEDDAFRLSNALTRGDSKKAIAIYRDLMIGSAEPVALIRLLAAQFRFLNQVRYLNNKGESNDQIANRLHCSYPRVNASLSNLRRMGDETLNNALDSLYQTELSIMSGKCDADLAFSLFLAGFSL